MSELKVTGSLHVLSPSTWSTDLPPVDFASAAVLRSASEEICCGTNPRITTLCTLKFCGGTTVVFLVNFLVNSHF